jgi:hypothetical protein
VKSEVCIKLVLLITKLLMAFYGKSGYANAPQCSIIRTWPLLSCIKNEDSLPIRHIS